MNQIKLNNLNTKILEEFKKQISSMNGDKGFATDCLEQILEEFEGEECLGYIKAERSKNAE